MIRRFLKDKLSILAYEVRKKPSIGFNPSYLSRICHPKTVIDVGAGHGTFALHKAFPEAHFVLIEPVEEYGPSIDKLAKEYSCEVYYKAVGDRECKLEMNIDTARLTNSSFLDRTPLTDSGNRLEKRIVEVTTLDKLFGESPTLEMPILLKIDAEGHELSALQGSKSLLKSIDTVIAEVSVSKRFENSYEFEDVISFMSENGFYLYSFLTMPQSDDELRPRFADVVFKRRNTET